jgi:hypothetical protein
MNKKKAITERDELSSSQRDAIRLLVSGCTAKYTSLVLKLKYADIRRWMSKDIQFQSELAAQLEKQQAQESEVNETSQGKKKVTRRTGSEVMKATKRLER